MKQSTALCWRSILAGLFGGLLAFSAAFLLWFGNWTPIHSISRNIFTGCEMEFNEGWTYLASNGDRQPISLPVKLPVSANDACTIETILPERIADGWALCFRSSQQTVEVRIDGQVHYTYNTDATRPFGKATPSTWNFVDLPSTAGGKTVRITFVSPYQEYSGNLNSLRIGSRADLLVSLLQKKLPGYILCVIFFALGLALVGYMLFVGRKRANYRSLRYLGLFTALVAIWLRCESKIPQIFLLDDFTELLVTFLALMLCPLPFILFLRYKFPKMGCWMLRGLFLAFTANFVLCTALQLLNVWDFIQSVILTHSLLIVLALMCLWLYLRAVLEKLLPHLLLEMTGLMGLLLSLGAEVAAFYNEQYFMTGVFLRIGLFVFILCLIISSAKSIAETEARSVTYFRQLQESRAYLMVSQMQPRFLCDTLTSIRSMLSDSTEVADKMLEDFSSYLQANMEALNSTVPIPFEKELEHVKAYVEIEKIQYGNRIKMLYRIGSSDFFVPPLTIQPLVENAIKHGISKRKEGGQIAVTAQETEDSYLVTVADNGVGFDTAALLHLSDETPIALKMIEYRLRVRMGATIHVESAIGVGTTVTVRIPKQQENVLLPEE